MRRWAQAVIGLVAVTTGVVVTGAPAHAEGQLYSSVEVVSSPAPGLLRVSGWVFDDDDASAPVSLHLYVQPGDIALEFHDLGATNQLRQDVAAAYPGAGSYQGFDVTLEVSHYGNQRIYLYARNAAGPGRANLLLNNVGNESPTGTLTIVDPLAALPSPPVVTPPVVTPPVVTPPVVPPPVVTPPVVSPPVVTPSAPPVTTMTLAVTAVRKKSRMRVDIGPDLEQSNYRFSIQRRVAGRWRTVTRTQTLGAKDVSFINLPRGRYRVVVPRQRDLAGTRAEVRLRR